VTKRLYLEVDEDVVRQLDQIKDKFGEATATSLIGRAIGLVGVVSDFVEDGVLTVVDPRVPEGDEKRLVSLEFIDGSRSAETQAA